jgi:CRP/FNR family transcriptional regulator
MNRFEQSGSIGGQPLMHKRNAVQNSTRLIATFDAWCERIFLRPQQRLATSVMSNRRMLTLGEGILAVEAIPAKGKRQILDFLLPGDVLSAFNFLPSPTISIRAITGSCLIYLGEDSPDVSDMAPDCWELLFAQSQFQLARANVHQLMVGHLDTEARVASFLLGLAMRASGGSQSDVTILLPMSREDIADHLAMNRDTLSRIMMRFESAALIERMNRHSLRVGSVDSLKRLTPIAALLSSVYERQMAMLSSIRR